MAKNCTTCKHKNVRVYDMPCCECTKHPITGEFSRYYPPDQPDPPTNADRLRAMSDEELAVLLETAEDWTIDAERLLVWLQSPAEGGDKDGA